MNTNGPHKPNKYPGYTPASVDGMVPNSVRQTNSFKQPQVSPPVSLASHNILSDSEQQFMKLLSYAKLHGLHVDSKDLSHLLVTDQTGSIPISESPILGMAGSSGVTTNASAATQAQSAVPSPIPHSTVPTFDESKPLDQFQSDAAVASTMASTQASDSLEAPSQTSFIQPASAPTPATVYSAQNAFLAKNGRKKIMTLMAGMVAGLLLISGFLVFSATKKPAGTEDSARTITSIPTDDLLKVTTGNLGEAGTIQINGPLKVTSTFAITPSTAPTNATKGQIYYDQNTNTFNYYDGVKFQSFLNNQSISEISKASTGAGIALNGNLLTNTGVTSLQGQTGALGFQAGNGIAINGLQISSTGLTSLQGATGLIVSQSGGIATIALPQDISILSSPNFAGLTLTAPLAVTSGGTGNTTYNTRGVLYYDGTKFVSTNTAGSNQCLVSNAGGVPLFAACAGGGGTVVNDITGDSGGTAATGNLTFNNATSTANSITIDDAGYTGTQGIASFSSSYFTVTAGDVTIANNAVALTTNTTGNYVQSVGTGNGLTGGAGGSEGATITINLNIQANKGLEADGSGLSLVDCAATEILKYTIGNQWACASDAGGSGTPVTSSGSTGNLVKFGTGAYDLVNSLLSEPGSDTLQLNNSAAILQGTGALTVKAANNNDLTLSTSGTGRIKIADTTFYNCDSLSNGGKLTTNAMGEIICAVDSGAGAAGADQQLNNLSGTVAINLSLTPDVTNSIDLGSTTKAWRDAYFGGNGTNYIRLTTATPTAVRTITLPDATGTVCLSSGNCVGAAGGGVNSTGSTDRITKFGATAYDLVNSVLSEPNADTIRLNSATATIESTGALTVAAGSGNNSLTLTKTGTGNLVFTGFDCTGNANGGKLVADGTGIIACADDTGAGPAGANQQLSNLSGTTAINLSLLADATNTRDLGSSGTRWKDIYLQGQATINGVVLNNTSLTPNAAFTIGATGQSLTLQGTGATTLTANGGGGTTTIGFVGTPVGNVTYNFDRAAAAGTYTICTTIGNCAGAGGGVTSAGGTTNYIPKFTAGTIIGNSILEETSSTSLTLQTGASAATVQGTAALTVAAGGANSSLTLTKTGTGNLVFTGFDCTGNANGGALTVNGSGVLSCSDDAGAGAPGADTILSNLTAQTQVSQTLAADANNTRDLGTNAIRWKDFYLQGQATINGVVLNNTSLTPAAAFTIGSTTQDLTLQGSSASTWTATGGGFTTTVGFNGAPVGNVTYNYDRTVSAGTYTICSTAGNCAGVGGGVTTPGGTTGRLAKFTASGTIGNSILDESGNTLTLQTTTNPATIQGSDALTIAAGGSNKSLTLASTGTGIISLSAPTVTGTGALTVNTAAGNNNLTIATGNNGAGASGNISIDVGTASSTAGTISIGTGNATGITLGANATGATAITVGQNTFTNTLNLGTGNIAAGQTGTINIGTNSASTGKTTTTIGSTNGDSTVTIQGGATGGVIVKNGATDSNQTFRVQNAASSNALLVDTTPVNALAINGNAELNATNWASKQNVTVTRSTAQSWMGAASISVVGGTPGLNDGVRYNPSVALSATTYSLSFYIKQTAGTAFGTNLAVGWNNGVSDTNCTLSPTLSAQAVPATGWARYTCSFTGSASGHIYWKQSDTPGSARTYFIDGVQLEQAATATAYRENAIQLNGVVTSPTTFKNTSDSTTAFQVQNAAGGLLFSIDSLNSGVTIKSPTNSTTAFQAQNSDGLNILGIDTSTGNLIANGSFENSANNWTTVSRSGGTGSPGNFYGAYAAIDPNTGANLVATANLSTTLATSTQYTLSFYAQTVSAGGYVPTLTAAYGGTTCSATSPTLGVWTKYTCTVTTGGGAYSTVTFTDNLPSQFCFLFCSTQTLIDGVRLESGGAATEYKEANISVNGSFITPVSILQNNTAALKIQNSSASTLLNADTTSMNVSINSTSSTGNALTVAGSETTGSVQSVIANSLTSGNGLAVSSNSTNINSGNMLSLNQTPSYTASSNIISGNLLNSSRIVSVNATVAPSVTLDATGGNTSSSWPHTITSSYGNRALVASVNGWVFASWSESCTATWTATGYAAQAMTRLTGSPAGSTQHHLVMFGLVNPNPGAGTIALGSCGATSYSTASSSWYNVDTSGGNATAFTGATSSFAASPATINITGTTTRDVVVDAYAGYGTSITRGGGQTVYGGGGTGTEHASWKAGTGDPTSVTLTSNSGSINYGAVGIKALPSAAGPIISGAVANLSSNCAVTAGSCTDSSNILNLNQQYASSNGAALKISNAGSGGSILSRSTSVNALTVQNYAGNNQVFNVDTTNSQVASGATAYSTGTISQTTTTITGNGTAFTSGMTGGRIYYSDGTSATITYVSGTSLTSSVSKTVPAGSIYAIVWGGFTTSSGGASLLQTTTNTATAFQVQNAAAQSLFTIDTSGNNITIGGNNSGLLQSWQTGTNTGIAGRDAHALVSVNGYIYMIGGANSGGTAQTTVQYSKVNADGNVGSWTTTNALPSARVDGAAAYANGYIYYTGGSSNNTDAGAQSSVYYAKVNSDGTLGTWQTASTTITQARWEHSTVAYNGFLYVIGGKNTSGTATSTTYYAPLNADGSVGGWTANTSLTSTAINHSSVIANGYLYVLGSENSTTVQYASVNSAGVIGTVNTTTALPDDHAAASVAVANGYIYLIGGWGGGATYFGATMSARINASGTLGSWTCQGSAGDCTGTTATNSVALPATRAWAGENAVVVNGYLYIVSGANNGGAANTTVYYASTQRIKFGGALDLVGLGGSNLADASGSGGGVGSSGGELTAGNTNIVGMLQVAGDAQFAQSGSFGRDLNVGGAFNLATGKFSASVADGASAVAYTFNNTVTLSTAGAKLLVIQNNGTAKFEIDKDGNLTVYGRYKSTQTTAPTAGTPTNCGTSPTAAVGSGSTDSAGSFRVTSGTGGAQTTCDTVFTFNGTYGTAPKSVIISPQTKDGGTGTAAARQIYLSNSSTTTFTIKMNTPPADSEINYYYYWVVE